jgi:hypothetical protein
VKMLRARASNMGKLNEMFFEVILKGMSASPNGIGNPMGRFGGPNFSGSQIPKRTKLGLENRYCQQNL